MNREIKFRIRTPERTWKYFDLLKNGIWNCPDGVFYLDTLSQYTGLKDKNGREIYEGDIFNCIYDFDGCNKHRLVVIYNQEKAQFSLQNHGACLQKNVTKTISDMTRKEIIGNIYENPELLPTNLIE